MASGLSAQEYLSRASDADVIIADAIAEVSGELIASMPNLKMIHSEGVAYNRIDCKAASKKGVYVCNSAGMNADAVAEQTILLMLSAIKNVAGNDRAVRDGNQIQVKEGYMVDGSLKNLSDYTVGLLGFGNIGQSVARLLKAFGLSGKE